MTENKHVGSRRATLKDVAEVTGVSVMTVSNVVNGKYTFVSAATRKNVEQAIKKLRYVPSATSRKLRSSQEFTIGMIIMDDEPNFLVNPFISQLVAGLSNVLSAENYSLTVQGVHPDELKGSSIFSSVGTDALCAILCGSETERRRSINFLLDKQQPVILFQETLRLKDSNFAVVNQDDRRGGEQIASHVLSKGAKRLVFVQSKIEWPAIEERRVGVMAAVAKVKGASCEVVVCEEATFKATQAAVADYFTTSGVPDAILGGTDALGIAAMRYCQDKGYTVPSDVMITGFNGFEACNYTNPVLTTIVSPAYAMGQYAASLILKRLRTNRFSKKQTSFPIEFRFGGST